MNGCRRKVFMLGALLLCGAIMNVAVAWGCAAFIDLSKPTKSNLRDEELLLRTTTQILPEADVYVWVIPHMRTGAARFAYSYITSRRDPAITKDFDDLFPRTWTKVNDRKRITAIP